MFELIKDCFKKINVSYNGQELSGVKKALAFVLCSILFIFIIGVSATVVIGAFAFSICLLPIALVFEGIRQIVGIVRDINELNKKKKDIQNNYSEQLKQIEESYNQNRDVIDNTMESLKTNESIVQDDKGSDVVVQELVPITLEDIESYIQYISQFNSAESQILEGHLTFLKEIQSKLDATSNSEERKILEDEYDSIMFIVQEKLGNHTEQINNINADKSTKKRRLFKENL